MGWITKLFGEKKNSGSVAKSRLQMVLSHDRTDITPGMMAAIKDDIISVLAQHLSIEADQVEVNLDQSGSESRLVAHIPLPSTRRR